MTASKFASLPLDRQLAELENQYAESLTGNADVGTLSRLWGRIQSVRNELLESATLVPAPAN
jgi:hypothetical protein